jgi:hypothetical protein
VAAAVDEEGDGAGLTARILDGGARRIGCSFELSTGSWKIASTGQEALGDWAAFVRRVGTGWEVSGGRHSSADFREGAGLSRKRKPKWPSPCRLTSG